MDVECSGWRKSTRSSCHVGAYSEMSIDRVRCSRKRKAVVVLCTPICLSIKRVQEATPNIRRLMIAMRVNSIIYIMLYIAWSLAIGEFDGASRLLHCGNPLPQGENNVQLFAYCTAKPDYHQCASSSPPRLAMNLY